MVRDGGFGGAFKRDKKQPGGDEIEMVEKGNQILPTWGGGGKGSDETRMNRMNQKLGM